MKPANPPGVRAPSETKAERERRLAEALRENLRKRKDQQRAREAGAEPAPKEEGEQQAR